MPASDRPSNIYIIGAQSTGKTTLVRALQHHFDAYQTPSSSSSSSSLPTKPQVITEVARGVLVEHSFTAHDITSSPARALALQELILKAQASAESAALDAGTWFISDRSGVDPIVYARKYVSESAATDLACSPEGLVLQSRMKNSVVIVCEAGVKWLVDDGVRLMPGSWDEWMDTHQLFCSCLKELELKYGVITRDMTDINERVKFVLDKWESYLVGKFPTATYTS